MPFLFKPYRLTRLTREVLARLRLKLVLSKQPLLFCWPRDRISTKRVKLLLLYSSLGVVVLLMLYCLFSHSS
jgi:hypothetical protein